MENEPKNKYFRMEWELKTNPGVLFLGPIMYKHSPDRDWVRERPYTENEAFRALRYFNKHYKKGIHYLKEVSCNYSEVLKTLNKEIKDEKL